jgi:nascent polypeptide-associated complex subunit alpha
MIPGMNPRQMKQMMKRMGVAQQEIDALEVIIKTPEKELVFYSPQVSKVNMMGQETFQIIGTPTERDVNDFPEINEEDINTVTEQTNVTQEEAKEAIIKSKGDLAEAIMKLQK